MSEEQNTVPCAKDYARFKAMHANIEAIEYLLSDLTHAVQKASAHILYNKADAAMAEIRQCHSIMSSISDLYQATSSLHDLHADNSK